MKLREGIFRMLIPDDHQLAWMNIGDAEEAIGNIEHWIHHAVKAESDTA